MTPALPPLKITVDGDRIFRDDDGNWTVDIEPADVQSAMNAETYAAANAAGPNTEVQVEVSLRGRNPVPRDAALTIRLPKSGAGVLDGAIVVKKPEGGRSIFNRTVHPTTLRDVHARGNARQQPTLSDALLVAKDAWPGAVPRKMAEPISAAHRASRAFVFDRAASYRVGELCAYDPELIADQMEFARVPYPRTFVELDAGAIIDALADAGLPVARDYDQSLDDKLGFLFTPNGIYTAAGATAGHGDVSVGWSPIVYRWHNPSTFAQEQKTTHFLGGSRMMIDQFLWGSSYDGLDPTRRRALRAMHGMDVLLDEDRFPDPGALSSMLQGGGPGDLRLALCVALLLIRPTMLKTVEERAAGHKMTARGRKPFLAHTVVTVKLTADQTRRKIIRAAKEDRGRAQARWHEVRGHYMHNHLAKTAHCVHDWEEAAPDRWECRKGCGGKRAWRTYPEGRGSATVGALTKHYRVTV